MRHVKVDKKEIWEVDIVHRAGNMTVRGKYYILNGRRVSQTIGGGEYGILI